MHRFHFLLTLVIATSLTACGDDTNTEPTAQTRLTTPEVNQQNMDSSQLQAVPGCPEYDPVPPEINPLPLHISFDPCNLMSSDFAQTLNIPLNQFVERSGGTRKIPGDHRYTPYVACLWRSAVHAVPLVSVEIQQSAENLEVNSGEAITGLGDAAWFGERRGRSELRMHLDDYVIFVRAELPDHLLDSKPAHEAIAKHLVGALKAPPAGPRIPLNASIFGGPKANICEAAKASGLADLLPGPKAWIFPTGAIYYQKPDELKAKSDADYVGCTFAGTKRGAVSLRFLGPQGVKRELRIYEKQTPVTISDIDGFIKRNGVYLPLGEGAFELSTTMVPFDDELLPKKLEDILKNIIEAVKQ